MTLSPPAARDSPRSPMPPLAYPRRRVPEEMDRPDLGEREHLRALAALGRANAVSRTAAALWPEIRALTGGWKERRPVRILDLACGGGHLAVALARRAARQRVPVELCGCDISARAVEFAQRLAARAGTEDVVFRRLDALAGPLPPGFDVVCSSLFLHHLGEEEAVRLMRAMREAAGELVLVSDLRRSRLGRAFAWAGCRLLSSSRVFPAALIAVRLAYPRADRLGGWLELLGQLFRRSIRANKLYHLPPELRRIRRMAPWHHGLPSPEG